MELVANSLRSLVHTLIEDSLSLQYILLCLDDSAYLSVTHVIIPHRHDCKRSMLLYLLISFGRGLALVVAWGFADVLEGFGRDSGEFRV